MRSTVIPMLRTMCKSKVHGATVTEANLQYTGSLTLDPVLMQAANLIPYEQVQVVNLNNGARFERTAIFVAGFAIGMLTLYIKMRLLLG